MNLLEKLFAVLSASGAGQIQHPVYPPAHITPSDQVGCNVAPMPIHSPRFQNRVAIPLASRELRFALG